MYSNEKNVQQYQKCIMFSKIQHFYSVLTHAKLLNWPEN